MKNIFNNKYLLLIFRIILSFVFIYAGTEKISDPAGFSDAINNYRLLPLFSVNFFAITLPWVELVAGVLLLFGVSVKENSFIISISLVVFILAIGISLARGLSIECGCFGTSSGTRVGVEKIFENIILLVMGFTLSKFDSRFLSLLSIKRKDNQSA